MEQDSIGGQRDPYLSSGDISESALSVKVDALTLPPVWSLLAAS
jgi:hypothetical protein